MVYDVNIGQHSNGEFEIKGIENLVNEKDLVDFPSQSVDAHSKDPNPSSFKCNLDMTKMKQLQWQDTHIAETAIKSKSKKGDKTLNYLDKYGIGYREITMDQIFLMQLWCHKLCNPIFYMRAIMH